LKKKDTLCTPNLIISYKNQLALGGWLEIEKVKLDRQIKEAQRTNNWRTAYYFSYNFLKFTNQYFYYNLMGCTYVPRI